jgi:hypothetical protein
MRPYQRPRPRPTLCQIAVSTQRPDMTRRHTYADTPTAFHLRAMNMLYEGLKRSNATIVIMPSTAVESMQLGGAPMVTIASAIAHAQTAGAPTPGPWGASPPPP